MHRGMWAKRLMKSVAPRTSFKSVRNRSSVASLSWPEKSEGSGRPIAASISATASSHLGRNSG